MGHLESIDGHRISIAPDLSGRLRRSEAFFDEFVRPSIDTYIDRAGIEAPPGLVEHDAMSPPERTELDLRAEGITSVLWATGYSMDHAWIDAPIADAQGIPRQHRGVSEIPGLYFIGLLWQHSQASATLFGPTVEHAVPRGALGPGPPGGRRDSVPGSIAALLTREPGLTPVREAACVR